MLWSRILLLILASITVLSCQKEEPETREKSLSRGFHLMDEGHYDDAIFYFEQLAQKDPHYHVKLAWASAYAGRAGVKIENIYAYALAAKKPLPEVSISGLRFDKQTQIVFKKLSGFLQQWEKIPQVRLTARNDLNSALQILSDKEEPGVRLYSAALRIVLLKSHIQEGVQSFEVKSQSQMCGRYLRPVFTWALKVLDNLSDLAVDLEKSFPRQADSYLQHQKQIDALRIQAKSIPLPLEDECF